MRLSDVMSSMGLALYAEVALVIFFAVFLGVIFHVYRRDLRGHFDRAGRMPLEDELPLDPRDDKEDAGNVPRQ